MKCPQLRTLGMNICRLRSRKDWTQEALAGRAVIHTRHLQHIEHGEVEPKFSTLAALCGALQCDWNTMMEGIHVAVPVEAGVRLANSAV